MTSHDEIVAAREALLRRTVAYFAEQPDVVGMFLAGSLPAGSADAYSDIDLRVIATPEGQARLVAQRLVAPSHWGDLLFNEWLDGTQHCVSHFRPFLKIDVFYWNTTMFQPSPWFKFPAAILLDRTGIIEQVLSRSAELPFPAVSETEVSRVLSKALAAAHEVVRRARRGELVFAQSLLEELRSYMIRLDEWLLRFDRTTPSDHKVDHRMSPLLSSALRASYAPLDAGALDEAVVALGEVLLQQIPDLHGAFALGRSLENDLHAARIVTTRQIA